MVIHETSIFVQNNSKNYVLGKYMNAFQVMRYWTAKTSYKFPYEYPLDSFQYVNRRDLKKTPANSWNNRKYKTKQRNEFEFFGGKLEQQSSFQVIE